MKRWLMAHGDVRARGGSVYARAAATTHRRRSIRPAMLRMHRSRSRCGARGPRRELEDFNKIFDGFTEKYPWITVNSVGGVNDQKIIAAINARDPPDAVLSFTLDNVGQFCDDGRVAGPQPVHRAERTSM